MGGRSTWAWVRVPRPAGQARSHCSRPGCPLCHPYQESRSYTATLRASPQKTATHLAGPPPRYPHSTLLATPLHPFLAQRLH